MTSHDVASVTYGAAALTKVADAASNSGSSRRISLWYLLNPNSGTDTVTVTLTASGANTAANAISFTHVDQITPFGTAATNTTTTAASLSASTDSTAELDAVVSAVAVRNNDPTPGAGQTSIANWAHTTSTYVESSTQAGDSGATTSSWSWAAADNAAMLAVPIHGV